jgi:pyruvate,orthophosphate dikinase
MQDIEFTVQRGKLWMLQTRSGKRTAKAALKIAVDMAAEGLITQEEAILRVDPPALDQLLHPTLDPKAARDVLTKGLPASPGAASGMRCSTADTAEKRAAAGESVILVRTETSPRRHSRHARRQGHPDRARRHDQPRRGRGARHGAPLRLGRGTLAIDAKEKLIRVGGREVKRRRYRSRSTARPAK